MAIIDDLIASGLSLPQAQALPEAWRIAYKDVDAQALRGGFRGVGITDQIRTFEKRLCSEHQMAFRVYEDYEAMLKTA